MPYTAEQLIQIRALPGAADVTDEDAEQFMLGYTLATCETNATLVEELNVAKAEVFTLSSAVPAAPVVAMNGEEVAGWYHLSSNRIDFATDKGDIPPAIARKLKADLGGGEDPNVFMLSAAAGLPEKARPIDYILGLFAGSKLGAPMGEKTGGQVYPLSRATPGDPEPTDDHPLKAIVAEMTK